MKKALLLAAAAALVAIDQLTKRLAIVHLKGQTPYALWPNVFELQYCENTGVAFSLLQDQRWLFIPLSLLVSVAFIVILLRSPLGRYKTFSLCCVLILAGGIGNLIDRIWHGFVVDFLYFKLINFPIFNFADCCVVVGACLLFIFLLFMYKDPDDIPLRTLLFNISKKKESAHGGE